MSITGYSNEPFEIRNIGMAYANRNMEGKVGDDARQYIADYNKRKKWDNAIRSMNYGVDISDYIDKRARSRYHGGDVTNYFDYDAYKAAQLDWMSGNAAFEGWSEDDMSDFLSRMYSEKWSDEERQAAQLWSSMQIGIRNSNRQKAEDRETMLAEIEAYKNGYSNEHIQQAVATERQAWGNKIQQILDEATNQAARQGRVMDTATYAMLRGRLEAQAANAIQAVQMQYEEKRQEYIYNALRMQNDVYQNTTNTVMAPSDVTTILNSMAGGNS